MRSLSPQIKGLAVASVILFIVSLIPYALSGGYVPTLVGIMNRINQGAGMAAGLLIAALLGTRLRYIAVTILAIFMVCHWQEGARWARAWEKQQEILIALEADLPPKGYTTLLHGTPPSLEGIPVFYNHYDLAFAIKLRTGRRDIGANWIYRFLPSKDGEVSILNGEGVRYDYDENKIQWAGVGSSLIQMTNIY